MRSLLYIIAVIMIIGWAIGVFAYSAGGIIHALLIIAIISFLIGIIRSPSTV
ncbi:MULTISPECIES: lmo0937 family membrane protein [Mucilaginibacter]|uniref:lmo0937 family membrane protein n=1 Tax=Mucilaginibacter TaxID=423349 RepID=UPI0020935CC2|nr:MULTISPECIES: lmo0937 family membrane protein [Mucilaginibacter]MCO5949616.1 lmo0937 family membrane protein [Mucilaginibacter flavidus]